MPPHPHAQSNHPIPTSPRGVIDVTFPNKLSGFLPAVDEQCMRGGFHHTWIDICGHTKLRRHEPAEHATYTLINHLCDHGTPVSTLMQIQPTDNLQTVHYSCHALACQDAILIWCEFKKNAMWVHCCLVPKHHLQHHQYDNNYHQPHTPIRLLSASNLLLQLQKYQLYCLVPSTTDSINFGGTLKWPLTKTSQRKPLMDICFWPKLTWVMLLCRFWSTLTTNPSCNLR